jgi:hypothetical protein
MAGTSSGQARGGGAQTGGRTTSISYLPSPFKVISIRSRKEAPVGRGLTFVPGNVETRIRSITERPSLLPTSQARIPTDPRAVHLPLRAEIRGYHVPLLKSARG